MSQILIANVEFLVWSEDSMLTGSEEDSITEAFNAAEDTIKRVLREEGLERFIVEQAG